MGEGGGGEGKINLVPLTSIRSPAFAEAAMRRQAPGERRYFLIQDVNVRRKFSDSNM